MEHLLILEIVVAILCQAVMRIAIFKNVLRLAAMVQRTLLRLLMQKEEVGSDFIFILFVFNFHNYFINVPDDHLNSISIVFDLVNNSALSRLFSKLSFG